MCDYFVLEDLTGLYSQGTIIDCAKHQQLLIEGVVAIPVVSSLFVHNAISGFFWRFLGVGVALPVMPSSVCQLAMYIVPGLRKLNWVAKLVPTSTLRKELSDGGCPLGTLRIVPDASQALFAGGLANIEGSVADLSTLRELREDGSWIVRGQHRIDAPTALFAGFALYGASRDMRVQWCAISQTE